MPATFCNRSQSEHVNHLVKIKNRSIRWISKQQFIFSHLRRIRRASEWKRDRVKITCARRLDEFECEWKVKIFFTHRRWWWDESYGEFELKSIIIWSLCSEKTCKSENFTLDCRWKIAVGRWMHAKSWYRLHHRESTDRWRATRGGVRPTGKKRDESEEKRTWINNWASSACNPATNLNLQTMEIS